MGKQNLTGGKEKRKVMVKKNDKNQGTVHRKRDVIEVKLRESVEERRLEIHTIRVIRKFIFLVQQITS
jgi:hypothetical protein